jgi:hypothetical protein
MYFLMSSISDSELSLYSQNALFQCIIAGIGFILSKNSQAVLKFPLQKLGLVHLSMFACEFLGVWKSQDGATK